MARERPDRPRRAKLAQDGQSETPRQDERVSLAPLTFEEALRGLLETDPEPVRRAMEARKKPKRKPERETDEGGRSPEG